MGYRRLLGVSALSVLRPDTRSDEYHCSMLLDVGRVPDTIVAACNLSWTH